MWRVERGVDAWLWGYCYWGGGVLLVLCFSFLAGLDMDVVGLGFLCVFDHGEGWAFV